MTVFDNPDHLTAVAQEHGQTPYAYALCLMLIWLAVSSGCRGADDCTAWVIASGYATPLPGGGFTLTDAGVARARAEAWETS